MAIQSAEEFANLMCIGTVADMAALITARDAAIRAEERELCARVADGTAEIGGLQMPVAQVARGIAHEIRARASSSATQPEPDLSALGPLARHWPDRS